MKNRRIILGAAAGFLLAGCATSPVVLTAVGPDPAGGEFRAAAGKLEVFSSVVEESDDQNQAGDGSPFWRQHTDYRLFTPHGRLVKYVGNSAGHYTETPRIVSLPPGRYIVRAQAEDYPSVEVPVVIEPGRTTRVHLDDAWTVPPATPKDELVSAPDGQAVGWRSGVPDESGTR